MLLWLKAYLARSLENVICPAVFVISNKSLNRNKKRPRSRYAVVADAPLLEVESNPAGFTY